MKTRNLVIAHSGPVLAAVLIFFVVALGSIPMPWKQPSLYGSRSKNVIIFPTSGSPIQFLKLCFGPTGFLERLPGAYADATAAGVIDWRFYADSGQPQRCTVYYRK